MLVLVGVVEDGVVMHPDEQAGDQAADGDPVDGWLALAVVIKSRHCYLLCQGSSWRGGPQTYI